MTRDEVERLRLHRGKIAKRRLDSRPKETHNTAHSNQQLCYTMAYP